MGGQGDGLLDALGVKEPSWVERGPTYLKIRQDTPFEEWLPFTQSLINAGKRVSWWIADALAFGDAAYGERYSQALDTDTYTYDALRNLAWVSRKVDLSRRRDTVPFSHHQEVASLPPDEQTILLDLAEDDPKPRAEFREQVKARKQAIAVEQALSAPAPAPESVPWSVRIEQADARSLPLDDDSVHLIVTSPPYGVDIPYVGSEDVSAGDWPGFMHDWLLEAFRVAAPSGRLAMNVPLDTTRGGFRPTYAQAVQMADAAGWEYRSTIIWFDDQLGKSTARGSLDSAAAPHVYAGAELIALFSKGEWRRESPGPSDLARDEWLEWTNGVWRMVGETQAWEGHPAPYPYLLPYRLIKLLSFPGDLVLDPFVGSGTSALAAHRLGRSFVGFDASEAYVQSARRRVVGGRGHE